VPTLAPFGKQHDVLSRDSVVQERTMALQNARVNASDDAGITMAMQWKRPALGAIDDYPTANLASDGACAGNERPHPKHAACHSSIHAASGSAHGRIRAEA
jgi:hypothetical protein